MLFKSSFREYVVLFVFFRFDFCVESQTITLMSNTNYPSLYGWLLLLNSSSVSGSTWKRHFHILNNILIVVQTPPNLSYNFPVFKNIYTARSRTKKQTLFSLITRSIKTYLCLFCIIAFVFVFLYCFCTHAYWRTQTAWTKLYLLHPKLNERTCLKITKPLKIILVSHSAITTGLHTS